MFSSGSSPTFLFLNTDFYGATFPERKPVQLFRDFHEGNSCSNIDLYSGLKLIIWCNRVLSITWLIDCWCLVKLYCLVLTETRREATESNKGEPGDTELPCNVTGPPVVHVGYHAARRRLLLLTEVHCKRFPERGAGFHEV